MAANPQNRAEDLALVLEGVKDTSLAGPKHPVGTFEGTIEMLLKEDPTDEQRRAGKTVSNIVIVAKPHMGQEGVTEGTRAKFYLPIDLPKMAFKWLEAICGVNNLPEVQARTMLPAGGQIPLRQLFPLGKAFRYIVAEDTYTDTKTGTPKTVHRANFIVDHLREGYTPPTGSAQSGAGAQAGAQTGFGGGQSNGAAQQTGFGGAQTGFGGAQGGGQQTGFGGAQTGAQPGFGQTGAQTGFGGGGFGG